LEESVMQLRGGYLDLDAKFCTQVLRKSVVTADTQKVGEKNQSWQDH
jgi:hypothetical protein